MGSNKELGYDATAALRLAAVMGIFVGVLGAAGGATWAYFSETMPVSAGVLFGAFPGVAVFALIVSRNAKISAHDT